jgi:glycogen synthase
MRIAFITPEFVTDLRNAGGLGNYLLRIGKLLVERGHQVEVFVSSTLRPRVVMHEVIRVERVYHRKDAIWPFTVVGRPPMMAWASPKSYWASSPGS